MARRLAYGVVRRQAAEQDHGRPSRRMRVQWHEARPRGAGTLTMRHPPTNRGDRPGSGEGTVVVAPQDPPSRDGTIHPRQPAATPRRRVPPSPRTSHAIEDPVVANGWPGSQGIPGPSSVGGRGGACQPERREPATRRPVASSPSAYRIDTSLCGRNTRSHAGMASCRGARPSCSPVRGSCQANSRLNASAEHSPSRPSARAPPPWKMPGDSPWPDRYSSRLRAISRV
jgi:hypothetical protein